MPCILEFSAVAECNYGMTLKPNSFWIPCYPKEKNITVRTIILSITLDKCNFIVLCFPDK